MANRGVTTERRIYGCIQAFVFATFFRYRPRLMLPVIADYCFWGLKWCREKQYDEIEWHNVVFSIES